MNTSENQQNKLELLVAENMTAYIGMIAAQAGLRQAQQAVDFYSTRMADIELGIANITSLPLENSRDLC